MHTFLSEAPTHVTNRFPRALTYVLLFLLFQLYSQAATYGQVPASKQNADIPVSAAGSLPAEEASLGWIRLFDGLTGAGWTYISSTSVTKPWRIANESFVATPGVTALTIPQFCDYELQFEYLLGPESSAEFLGAVVNNGKDADKPYTLRLSNSNGVDTPWRRMTLRTVPGGYAVFSLDSELTVEQPHRNDVGSLAFRPIKGSFRLRRLRLRPVVRFRPAFTDKLCPLAPSPTAFKGFQTGDKGMITLAASGGDLQFEVPSSTFVFQVDAFIVDGYGRISVRPDGSQEPTITAALDNRIVGIDHTRPAATGTGGFINGSKTREIVADNGQPFTLSLVVWHGGAAIFVNGYFTASQQLRTTTAMPASVISMSADTARANIKLRNLRLSVPQSFSTEKRQ